MVTSEVEIFNLAVGAIGVIAAISDPNENSREAELCRLYYPNVRDKVLRAAPWSEAKASKRLQLLATRDDSAAWAAADPDPGWLYAYKTPSDFLYPRYLSTYTRFTMSSFNGVNALMTNEAVAILTYTFRQTDVSKWNQGLVDSVSNGLGAMLASPLTGKRQRMVDLINVANDSIMMAQVQVANEDNQNLETLPDWLSARGISGPLFPNRYIYPVGSVLSITNLNV